MYYFSGVVSIGRVIFCGVFVFSNVLLHCADRGDKVVHRIILFLHNMLTEAIENSIAIFCNKMLLDITLIAEILTPT